MVNGFKVITLCGSTRFKEEFLEAQKRLTLEGNIVISVGLFGHSGDDVVWTEGVKDMLDRQHLAKIDLADEIYVINVGGYIGDSTRREIAYAEYKGKSITFLENCRKPSLYDNYAALSELHDAGRISDEDFEKAGRDFDNKRQAAIDEYNACQGPWPYQWDNVDVVVCGILQQHGLVSIDYHDIKDLYDADCVYEARIKGKGDSGEAQLQSIIDTIKTEYLPQLRSSKKVVLTLCGTSVTPDLLGKIADCMDGQDVVLQARALTVDAKDLELSSIFNKDMRIQDKLHNWAEKTVSMYNPMAEKAKLGYYTQSPLSRINKKVDLLILGINPGAEGGSIHQCGNDLLLGNPCFRGKDDMGVISIMRDERDIAKNRKGWDLWHKLHKMLNYSGKGFLIESPDRFVLSNMVFFGTRKEGQIPKTIDQEECAKQTIVLIDILHPKVVLLLGVKCKKLFEETTKIKMEEIEAGSLSYCKLGDSYVFAIKHTARFYSNAKCDEIGKTIGYAFDYPDKFEEQFGLLQLKHKIGSHDSIQWINSEGILIHEYWCLSENGCKKENGTISIGLKIDNEKDKYVLSVLSKGNHPDKFEMMINDFCYDNGWLRPNNDASYTISLLTDENVIADFMVALLKEMKDYRETDFPH